MKTDSLYDIAIAGGGLAGLALSIQCAKAGYRAIVFEKEKYPFHKVCGEYISFESWDFLEDLGMPLSEMDLPAIRKLQVSAPNGKLLEHMLPLGGFGLSRYKLDSMLADIARKNGVRVMEGVKVDDITNEKDSARIWHALSYTEARIAAGSFGKRSNIDIKWKRKFTHEKHSKLNNYVGVKYHIKIDYPADTIALHNFMNGYCGISQVEEGKSCLCYLTAAQNLSMSGNSIKKMEENILRQNPFLNHLFPKMELLMENPVIISQISFEKKTQIENNTLMIGDAAGMITPLCGNGMSMALVSSKIAFEEIDRFLSNKISLDEMGKNYSKRWHQQFDKRLHTGRLIQRFFGNPILSNILIRGLKPFPFLVNKLISNTHGQPF